MKSSAIILIAILAGFSPSRTTAQEVDETPLLKGRLEKQLTEISVLDAEIQSLSQMLGREGTPLPRREPRKPTPPPEMVSPDPVVQPAPVLPPGEALPTGIRVRPAVPVEEPTAPQPAIDPSVVATPQPPMPEVPPIAPPPATAQATPATPENVPTEVALPADELPRPGPPILVDEPEPIAPPPPPPVPAVTPVPTPIPPPAPVSSSEYTVIAGDTFNGIARKSAFSASELQNANPGVDPKKLQVGQKLRLPTASASTKPTTAKAATTANNNPTAPAPVKNTYTVQSGDTLHGIARRADTTVDELCKINGITNPIGLRIGAVLKLPAGASVQAATKATDTNAAPTPPRPLTPGSHVVKPGETLYSISKLTGTPLDELRRVNDLKDDTIHPGQSLKVRRGRQTTPPAKESTAKPTRKTTSTPARPVPAQGVPTTAYTVREGDSLFSIANRYFLSRAELAGINGMPVDHPLVVGQIIRLPAENVKSRDMAENSSQRH